MNIRSKKDQIDIDFENRVNRIGIKTVKRLAATGSVYCQCILGICFAAGVRVRKNFETAVYWYKQAAEQG